MNLSKPTPARGFSDSEYTARTENAQAQMRQQALSGLLLMTEPEVRYFTGFQTLFWQSPTRPWFVFIPLTGKPVAIIPEIGADLMRRGWVDAVHTWSAPAPNDDGITLLTELLSPLAASGQSIGVMKGHETSLRMPLSDWERLTEGLPGLQVHDASALIQGLRMIKSDAEIEKLRYVCAIGSATFADVPGYISEGMPLEEVFRQFKITALRHGADDVPYLVGGADQGGYSDIISPPTNRSLQRGDVLMMDTGCTWDGYYCDFDRNWAISESTDAARRAYDVLWRASEAGIDAARPGNTCRDLFHAMSSVIKEVDSSGGEVGRLGHGLGMQLTEQPSHAAFDETVLRENMVITIEPSLSYGDGHIMVHEENIVIGNSGAELLTERAPLALPVI